jgi:hypothetical protein
MVRHRECYDDSLKASRTGNGPVRYSLLGFAEDILEVSRLALEGGAGPIGPNYERLYWREEEKQWVTTPAVADKSSETSTQPGEPVRTPEP